MKITIAALLLALLSLGIGASPALSIEPSDGGIVEGDQNADFDDPDAFEAVGDVEDDLNRPVDEEADVPDRVRRVGLVGIWQYTGKSEGWFAGKLYVRGKGRRVLVGRVKGVFEKSLLGRREMAGVILDRKGNYQGKLEGVYGKRGFTARWTLRAGDRRGKARAKFVCPYGRAGFVGKAFAPRSSFQEDDENL